MKKGITFVGMDAHKVANKLAVLLPGHSKPVEWEPLREREDGGASDGEEGPAAAPGEVRLCVTRRGPAATRCSDGSRRRGRCAW